MELPRKMSLKEEVEEFFRKPVVSRSGLAKLFDGNLEDVLRELVEESVLVRKHAQGKYYYTLAPVPS